MESTPIEIFNNNSIELNRVVKINGKYYFVKRYLYLADIESFEASKYGIEREAKDRENCTKIEFQNGAVYKFKEPYKNIRDTYKVWQKWLQEHERQNEMYQKWLQEQDKATEE